MFFALIIDAFSRNLFAQNNPLSSEVKGNYNNIKNNLLKGADKMPEADYNFKPAPEGRTFGEVVTHIATVQAALCASAKGETKAGWLEDIEGGRQPALLKTSIEYCDPVYDALTDTGMQMGKMFGVVIGRSSGSSILM